MAEFGSWLSYTHFRHRVTRNYRYAQDTETRQFLDAVMATTAGREQVLPEGKILWRAQLGNGWQTHSLDNEEYPAPLEPERMLPLRDGAREGRANPKGIPCLYLATTKETAMGEVRPWVGAYVSVAQFTVLADQMLIDCSLHDKGLHVYLGEPDAEKRQRAVWADIDRAFSEPVTASDHTADYAPTQILAEMFKTSGYDGIVYTSSLGTGYNVALFSLNAVELINCSLYEVDGLKYAFSEAANPYYIRKHQGGVSTTRSADHSIAPSPDSP